MQDVTNIRQLAHDRLGLLPDGAISYQSILDPDPGLSHAYLSTLPTTDSLITLCHRETLGAVHWSMYNKQINYDPTRPNDASLLFKVDGQSSKGTFWDSGLLLTAGKRTDTSATNGASVDFGQANLFGLQAYLHVFAFTGTNCTITIQSSSDNG